jgi:hypothetical protein
LIETLTFSFLFHLPIPLALSLFSLYFTTTTLRLFLIYGLHNNTIMEGPNQPPTWPLAPTVEDELSPDDQTTPAGTDTHTADPGTPVNNGGTTTTTNNDAPQTRVALRLPLASSPTPEWRKSKTLMPKELPVLSRLCVSTLMVSVCSLMILSLR